MPVLPHRFPAILYPCCLILALLPWLAVCWPQSINYDIAWLLTAARRLLAGGGMYADFFETNPPLSVLIYTPAALLSFLIPPWHAAFIYSLLLTLLSAFAVYKILDRWKDLFDDGDVKILAASYLIACLILPSTDFGERDHLVLLGLFPFLLAQLSITKQIALPPRLQWPVLIAGTVLILVKPHHGLIPALLLIHRAISRKSLSVIRDRDFLCLACGSLLYAAIVLLFFHDYVTKILPDVIALYLPLREPAALKTALSALFLFGATAILTAFLPLDKTRRNLVLLLFGGALLSLIPFIVQGKDFWYQIVPAYVFFFCGTLLLLHSFIKRYVPHGVFLSLALAALLAYGLMPPNLSHPHHDDYKAFPLTKIVERCVGRCPFFLFNNNISIIYPTALYTGREHASRFPSFWFLPPLVEYPERYPEQIDTYRRLVTEDFKRYEPETVILGQFDIPDGSGRFFDFPAWFSENAAFADMWKHYELIGTIEINRGEYLRGSAVGGDDPATYEIYHRRR